MFKRKNIGFLILAFVSFNLSAQSVIQIEKRAFEAYKLAQYATAKVDFQQLLARDPESDSYNFHYAVCLYHTENKSNARKYFEFVANRSVAFCDAHYYLGKIHHLSYRFNDAIASFKSYLACSPSDGLNAKKEITYCNNGNVLLEQPKSLTTMVAQLATEETFIQKFDIEEIGGKIYADPSLQTKADKKKAYIPICYYKRGDTYKFYASYGDDPAQLSLFYIQRISQDVWSKPTQLALTSPASDLVYPFFDSQAKRLYFSSNGFNSMGGFDLFSVSFDPETNTLGTVENLNFPFSSSADDFFFVPLNPSATIAWFASDRNVATGRIEALKVSYAVNAGNLIALSGQFTDLVNPKNTRIQIKVKDTQDGTEYGPFTSDENGKYNMLLPGAGTYVFSAYIDGTEKIFENEQTLPDQKENVIFKQSVKYSMDQGNELAGFSYDFKGGMTEEMKAFKANSISQLSLSARPVLTPTQVSTAVGDQENVEEQLTSLNLGGNNLTEKSELLVDKLIEISNTGFDLQDTAEDLERQKNQVDFKLKTFSDQASRYKELLKGQDSIANQFYAKELIQLLDSIQKYELKLLENTLASQRNSKHIDSWNALNVEPSINALSDQIKMALIQENQDSLVQVLSRNQEAIREFIEYPASIAIQDVNHTSSSEQTVAELTALRKSEVQLMNEIARINDEKSQAKRKELEQLNADQAAKEKQLSTISSLIAEKEHEQIKAELANSFEKEGFTLSDSTLEGLVARVQKKQEAQQQAARIANQTPNSSVNSTEAKALSNQISLIKAENEVIKNRLVLANPQEQEALAVRSQQLEARLDSLQTLKFEQENITAQNPVQPKITETTPVATDPTNTDVNPNITAQNPVQSKTTETTPVVTGPTNPEVNPNISAQNPVQPKTTETTPVLTDPTNPEVNPNISSQNPVQPKTTETTPVVTDSTNPDVNPNISAQNPGEPKTTETTPVVTDPTNPDLNPNISAQNPVQPKTTEITPVVTEPTNTDENPNNVAQNPVQPKITDTTPVVTHPTSMEAFDNRWTRAINELDEQHQVISTMERENGLIEAETSILKDQLSLASTLFKLKMEVGDSVYASVLTNKEIEGLTQGIAQSIAKVNEKLGNAQRLDIDLSDISQGLQGIAPNPTTESLFTVPKSVVLTDTELSGLSSEGSYDAYVTLRKEFASLRAKKLDVMQQLDELKLTLYRLNNSEETKAIISQVVGLADEIKKLERQEAQVLQTINAMPQKEAYHYLIEQGVAPKGGDGQLSFSKDQVVFSMNTEKKQGNSYPVLTSMPSGLVFRVQVGVFRKPVPDYFFREFTPVSGERLTNELTAYLTGFFASSTEAMNARGQVRNTGYSDAFIVAYCDGKRIPYQVALNYEKQGLCKVRNKQELESEAWSLMSAALSASTPVAEIPREVYYTVQVAALKRLDNGKLANVPELFYNESNMGLYKYSSGKFNQINLAKARRTALKALGYADAYIVAYRDGIPVSFKEAEVALAYKQEQPNLTKSNVEPVNKGIEGVAIQVPEKTYYSFTKEIDTIGLFSMAQYNRMQMFVLQPNSLHSAPIERQEISPLLAIFYSDFKLNLEGKEKPNKLSIIEDGDKFPLLHDFALRNQIPFRVMVIENVRKQIDFYPSSAENSQLIYNLAEALTLEVTSN
ncbi:MAG: hypothetical protein RL365_1363 [Bacteroidota bacterium]